MRTLDFSLINEWLRGHEHAEIEEKELPVTGFVVEDEGYPICIGFLRMVEGDVAIAESLVTDPEASLVKRVKAIDTIVEKLISVARDREIKYLMTTTVSTGVISRISKNHGFERSEQVLLIKDLT